MNRTSIEEWILKELWNAYPEGAAKNQLATREMAEYIRRWEVTDNHTDAFVSGKRAAKIAAFRNGGLKSVDAALAYTHHGCYLQPDSEHFEQGVTSWEKIWYSSFDYHRQIHHPEEYKKLL